jgi:hypothetical protein
MNRTIVCGVPLGLSVNVAAKDSGFQDSAEALGNPAQTDPCPTVAGQRGSVGNI